MVISRKVLVLTSFASLFPLFFVSAFTLLLLPQSTTLQPAKPYIAQENAVYYQALPEDLFSNDMDLVPREARVDALREFMTRYESKLTPYAQKIVDEADKNGLDYRLLPAIAVRESTLCKRIPVNSFNCWGFGIYGTKVTRFPNFDVAIETVSKTLAEKYHAQGLTTPHEIMSKYTPSNNGEWADTVSFVMERIDPATPSAGL